jgi:hypothetical protein
MTVLSILFVVVAALAVSAALSAAVVVPVYRLAARRLADRTAERLAKIGPRLDDGRLDPAFVEQLRHEADADGRLLEAIERRQQRCRSKQR